jgi:hypothetical protein
MKCEDDFLRLFSYRFPIRIALMIKNHLGEWNEFLDVRRKKTLGFGWSSEGQE